MKSVLSAIGSVVLVMLAGAAVLAIPWVIQGNDFFLYKVFAPQYESVRRDTFEQSKSFNQGMIQELQNMQFEYVKADNAHQSALSSIILHRVADYDETKLPSDLRRFISQLRQERSVSR